jgi:hypothetical protein
MSRLKQDQLRSNAMCSGSEGSSAFTLLQCSGFGTAINPKTAVEPSKICQRLVAILIGNQDTHLELLRSTINSLERRASSHFPPFAIAFQLRFLGSKKHSSRRAGQKDMGITRDRPRSSSWPGKD